MDEEEGKMKIDALNSMIELAVGQKQQTPDNYLGKHSKNTYSIDFLYEMIH